MSATTNEKKLDGAGLATVWSLFKAGLNTLAATVEGNRIKVLGDVSNLSFDETYAKNSLVMCSGETFLSNSMVQGLPTHILSYNDEPITLNGQTITYGSNQSSSWDKIAGAYN